MNGTGSCPGLGVRRSRMNPPHTCPGSHLSLLGSSRRVGGHRRRGGRAARGAERSERGPKAPRRRSAPPSGRGRDGGEWRWGAPGARPSHGLRRGPSRGRSCSGGLSPSVPQANGGSSGAGCTAFAWAPLSPGVRVPAHLPSPRPASPLPSAPGALTGPFPIPRVDLGPPHCFRGSRPAHRRFPGRVGDS